MDDERKDLQPGADDAFSLEDILKEFSADPDKPFEPEDDVL